MKHPRAVRLAYTVTVAALGVGGLASPALAAEDEPITVCAALGQCDFDTIQAAVTSAADGDTIEVIGNLAVAGTTTINKDVTVTGAPGVTVTQTATAVTFLITGDGATLSDLTITSDTPKAREFVQIGGDDVTVSGNTVYGPEQALPMSGWVTNRGVVTQGGISGLTLTDNTIHTVRSGAYLNPNGSGEISGNTLYNTKGDFLIDNANFTFTDNRAGDLDQRSEWGFVVFAGTATDRYPSMAALSADNNGMTAWDQRTGEKFVPPATSGECKDRGWQTFANPDFKNQGQCIKFVNTGK
jgi:hypothetical protein